MHSAIAPSLVPRVRHGFKLSRSLLSKVSSARHMSETKAEYYDIIISGSGLIGGAMACAVGESTYFANKKALVLEAQSPPSKANPFDVSETFSNRVCAISPASKTLLNKIGVWEHIGRKGTVKKMQVWDACSDALITFEKDNMTTDLCYIVENNLIMAGINRLLHEKYAKTVEIKYEAKIRSCTLPKNYALKEINDTFPNVTVELTDGRQFETSLLVAADGAKSIIAKQANFSKLSWEYGQSGVVATLKLSEPVENNEAWQRFLPGGPIAMLPLDATHSSLVWSTSSDHAEDLLHLDEADFVTELNDAFWKEYARKDIVTSLQNAFNAGFNPIRGTETPEMQLPPVVAGIEGGRAKFPLGLSHSNEYVKPRLALIGDAAHRVHPLAGQGANLGFGDVSCLMDTLDKAVYDGKDIGCIFHLLNYEKKRQLRNAAVTAVIDGLNKLYSNSSTPVVLLRTLGLMAVNANQYIKEQMINQAMS